MGSIIQVLALQIKYHLDSVLFVVFASGFKTNGVMLYGEGDEGVDG